MRFLLATSCLFGLGLAIDPALAQAISNGGVSGTSSQSSEPSDLFTSPSGALLRGANADNAALSAGNRTAASTGQQEYPIRPEAPVRTQQSQARSSQDLGPYDAEGLRLGTFQLFPSLSLFSKATDNLDNSGQTKSEGATGSAELDLQLRSDWARHRLQLDAKIGMEGYNKPERKPDHVVDVNGELQLELGSETNLLVGGGYKLERESANSVDLRASGGTASIQNSLTGRVQLDRDAGLIFMQLRGSVQDESYDQDKSRDYRTYVAGGRLGYHVTDQVSPFVDVEASRKRYDQRPNNQDGDTLRASLGVEVKDRDKLSGEASIGYMVWRPETAGQSDDAILFADASLTWSPNPLWTVTAGLETSLTSSSTAAKSVLSRTLSLGADYEMRENLMLRGKASIGHQDYNGIGRKDWVSDGTLEAEYSLNRHMQFIARVGHERRDSTVGSESYASNKVEFGIKLQK